MLKRDPTATGSTDDGGRTAEEPIRIGLADDHVVVRSGLCMLLDSESDFEVVAEAGDVQSAANLVREHHARVLVLDLNMPGGSSLEAIPHIRQESPDTQVVVLTMEQDPAFACEALGAGALGYVLKEGADDELVEAVRCAAAGEGYLSSRLGARLASEDPLVPDDDLSAREIEVLTLLALGHTNSETADLLLLSVRSVEAYRKRVPGEAAAARPCRAGWLRAGTRADHPEGQGGRGAREGLSDDHRGRSGCRRAGPILLT